MKFLILQISCLLLLNASIFAQDAPKEKSAAVLEIEATIEAGQAFLKKNAEKEGVITLPSGLQYEVIQKGSGSKPNINNKVKTHYHGTLLNGDVFDSSRERGVPASFPLSRVIKGWQEGIPLMNVGGIYRFYIPYQLGYGLRAAGSIPAGSMLIFEVVLLGIEG